MHNIQSDFDPSTVIYTDNIETILSGLLSEIKNEKVFILVDENTRKYCLPVLNNQLNNKFHIIEIEGGEKNKSLDSVNKIWQELLIHHASKSSLLINLGGGIITDMGGFAASTYKRGMRFIHIPTTLMAQVDAAIGGKNGINLSGYKNQIGVIQQAEKVIIYPEFLKTLDNENYLSGFAEIIKYSFISNIISQNEVKKENLADLIKKSIEVKNSFVLADPYEKNIRKALNFGHNFAHAFESIYVRKNQNLLHGYAVSAGLVCELYLSAKKFGVSFNKVDRLAKDTIETYGKLELSTEDKTSFLEALEQDKKNFDGKLIFTLVNDKNEVQINQTCFIEEINEALEYYLNFQA